VSWTLEGMILIGCNCDWGCPCNVNARPTQGHCEGGWTWHVESGAYDDVALDGLTFSVFADWPGAIHEGDGKAVSFMDERASAEQQEALTTLIRGDAGGPWSIFITTYELEGPRPVPYEVEVAGERSWYRVGSVAELSVEPIRNPVTGAEVHPSLMLPEGLVTKNPALFASKTFRVSDGIAYDHSGRYAAVGPFSYSGQE